MKFGKKSAGAIVAGLSLVMALAPVTPAFAEGKTTVDVSKGVTKELHVNTGSNVDATFKFTASPVTLNQGENVNGNDVNGDDTSSTTWVPTIDDIEINTATKTSGTAAIHYQDFPAAGLYAWKITETPNTYVISDTSAESMSYDTDTSYILVAEVQNTADGPELTASYMLPGDATSTSASGKVGTATFTNTYVETPSNTKNGTDLTITKTVLGNQADKTAKNKFHFKVTFTAPTYTNDWKVSDITAKMGETTIDNKGGVFEFDAASADSVSFSNVPVGTTYKVEETQKAGYEGSYYVNGATTATATGSKGANVTAEGIAITEGTGNSGEMKNTKEDTVVTGVIVNNAPFIVMIGAAAAGVVAYGSAKRKLEK